MIDRLHLRAITLIELIVIIAIVAIFFGLLLTSVRSPNQRESAQRIQLDTLRERADHTFEGYVLYRAEWTGLGPVADKYESLLEEMLQIREWRIERNKPLDDIREIDYQIAILRMKCRITEMHVILNDIRLLRSSQTDRLPTTSPN